MADDFSLSTIAARLGGVSWDDIHDFVNGFFTDAQDAGHPLADAQQYIGMSSPLPMQDTLNASWRTKMADDPSVAAALDSAQPGPVTPMEELPANRIAGYASTSAPPTQMPSSDDNYQSPLDLYGEDARGHYADAITAGQVLSAKDFAERYAGAYWSAAGGDEDHGLAVTRAAGSLASQLPSDDDFTDAAIAISHRAGAPLTPEDIHTVKASIADHWADTGQSPMDTYKAAYSDTELAQSLIDPPKVADGAPWWVADPEAASAVEASGLMQPAADSFGTGMRDIAGGATQLAANALPRPFVDAVNNLNNHLVDLGVPLARVPQEGIDAMEKERLRQLTAEGADEDWARTAGQVVATLPMFTSLGLEGAWGLVAAGATGGAATAAFTPSTAEDYWSAKAKDVVENAGVGAAFGGALGLIGKAVAAMAPAAARALGNVLHDMPEPKVKVVDPGAPLADAVREVAPQEAYRVAEPAPESMPGEPAPVASPAENVQALARDALATSSAGETPMLRSLAGKSDEATQELATGYDAATALRSFINDTLPGVMKDESGSLNLGNLGIHTPETVAERAQNATERDYGRELVIREMVGNAQRDMAHYTDMLEPNYPAVLKNMGTWKREIGLGPAGDPMNTPIGQMIDYIEGRSKGVMLDPNSPLKPVADAIRDANQAMDQRLRQQAEDGRITYDGYIRDYYVHQWTDPRGINDDFGTGKLGSNQNLMERSTFPTIADGIRAGREPRLLNPLDATLADLDAKTKYSHAADMIADMEDAGHGYWAFGPKDGTSDKMIQGGLGTKLIPTEGSNSGEKVLREAHFYTNGALAQSMNDWLSRGLYSRPTTASMLDKLMWAKNTTTALKLLLPGFHANTVAMGSIGSAIGRGLEEASRGQFLRAFASLGSAPFSPLTDAATGLAKIKAYARMSGDPVIKALTDAGMTFGKPMSPESGATFGPVSSIFTSLRRGGLQPLQGKFDIAGGLANLGRDIGDSIVKIGGDPRLETSLMRGLKVPPRLLDFGVREAGRLMSTVMAPTFDVMIPAIKVGSAYKSMESFMKAHPTASVDAVHRYARQVAMDMDNRLGELNMNTVFWPKMAKQIANGALISPGWIYGTYRNLFAAGGWNIERRAWELNPKAISSLVGLTTAYGMYNALFQYAHTGQMPWDTDTPLRDFLDFRTSGVTKTGAPQRGGLPSELKEIFDLAKVVMRTYAHPGDVGPAMMDYLMPKLQPALQFVHGLLTGEDGIGHKIADMPGGIEKFIEDSFEPIIFSALRDRPKGTQISVLEQFMGIREPGKFVEDPDAYRKDLDNVHARATRDEIARAIREQSQLETPNEDIAELKTQLATLNQQLRAQQQPRFSRAASTREELARGIREPGRRNSATRPRSGSRPQTRVPRPGLGRVSAGQQGVGGGAQNIGGGAQGV